MGVKKGVRPRYDWTISEILNFTVELSRTRCRNFSDILKTKSSAEYILEFPGDSKKVTALIWPAAPPAPAGLVLVAPQARYGFLPNAVVAKSAVTTIYTYK